MNYKNNVVLKEGKLFYLFSLILAIVAWIGTMIYGFQLGGFVILIFSGITYIYFFIHLIKYHYQWNIPDFVKIVPVISLLLLIISSFQIDFRITILAFFICILSSFIGTQYLSVLTYTMELNYDNNNQVLEITYNKIFIKINESFKISEDHQLNLIPRNKMPLIASRKGLFHSMQLNKVEINIAPISLNGFSLFNKMILLFPKDNLNIGFLSPPNERLFVPSTKGNISIPNLNVPESYHNIEEIDSLINTPNFQFITPRSDRFVHLKVISILVSIIFGIIYLTIVIISSYAGITEEIPWIILKYYIWFDLFFIAIIILNIRNALTMTFGNPKFIITKDAFIVQYIFHNKLGRNIEVKIHKLLNPVLIIENDVLKLVIKNKNSSEFFYQHRIGKFLGILPYTEIHQPY